MFTLLTIGAAWFAFGYSVTDLGITIFTNNKKGKYDIDYASTIEDAYDELNKIIGNGVQPTSTMTTV